MEAWLRLECDDVPTLEGVQEVVEALKACGEEDIAELFESKRVGALFAHMEGVNEEAASLESALQLQSAYLSGVKAIMGKVRGLERLCRSTDLVGRLALSLDSPEVSICTQVLELLAVLAVTSEEGYESVRKAMEYFRIAKRESVRFESLVDALASATPTHFKRDVMLFVNTLVNSAPDVEQRVEIRGELVRAGALEAIDRLKQETLSLASSLQGLSEDAYELEVQLQVFETVSENDHRERVATFGTSSIRLDDPDQLFGAIKQHCIEFDSQRQLVELLQYLVAIPCFDPLGKEHWAQILRTAHRVVVGVDDDFALGFEELRTLATWKQALEDRSAKIKDLEKKLQASEKARKDDEKKKEETTAKPGSTLGEDPRYAKYFTMLKMHIPRPAVEAKMTAEGVDPAILDLDPCKPTTTTSPTNETKVKLKDDPKYAKYFKMLKMHLPRPAVEAKMKAEGVDPSVLDMNPEEPMPEAKKNDPPKLGDDPKYAKYFKMLKMHLPRPAVEAKMKAEGVDPSVLDMDPNGPVPSTPKLGDDPKYAKYFKMLKMHLPRPAVEAKMKAEGVDPSVLDMDPEQPVPRSSSLLPKKSAPLKKQGTAKKDDKPKKANPKPRVPMRSLFWSKIEDREKTVWKNLSDESVDLQVDVLEADFAKVRKDDKIVAEKQQQQQKEEKKKEITLVDGKVSQNVGIVLHKLKMTNAEVCEAIVEVDEEKLDPVKCELLLKSCPTPEDAAAVSEFSGDVQALGRVELFFRDVAYIPDIKNRLECMVFKHKLDTTCQSLDDKLNVVTKACERVSRSERLAKLLEVVLKLGNYLNGGTARGGVYGFKLDALPKLATVKSLDNQKTLMNWLVAWCEAKDPSLVGFHDDFPEIEEAARCSLPQWQADLAQLDAKIKLLGSHIAARRKSAPDGDRFVEIMTPFRERAAGEAATLAHRFQATEQRFGALVDSFGEDPKTCGVEEFFKNLLGEFVSAFAKARAQNDKRRAMEEKARQREMAAEKRAQLKQAGDTSESLVNDTFASLKAEAADDILAKLQGPRMRRQATRQRTLAQQQQQNNSGTTKEHTSPTSDRLKGFVDRVQGVKKESGAQKKLDGWRTRGHNPPAWQPSKNAPATSGAADTNSSNTPPPNAERPPPLETPQAIPPTTRPRRASIENQSELRALAADEPAPPPPPNSGGQGGELLAKLQKMKGRKKKPPAPK
ncbi:hypothetical protein CTAYLR_009513 [Chrysophaeum taylorii]|uniref:FH2 domain-containing protein n=1 Tax=Chrysophaeum taylorii TaxID=2483200 RepID=A0AAD7UNQ7_9STRA|nr:hypothetical protein CTAYLR_009513 [Chrysophaeum taylorii]